MALSGIDGVRPAPSKGVFAQARARIEAVLRSEHLATQKAAGVAFAVRVASAGIVFASQILLARWIGDSEFGSYVYVLTWLVLAGDLVHLGLPLTAQRFIPQYNEANSLDLLRGYLLGSRLLCLGAGIATAIGGGVVVYALENVIERSLIIPFYFACLAVPAYTLNFMIDGLARSYNWMNVALLPAYVVRPLVLLGGVVAIRVAGFPLDASDVLAVLATSAWIAVLLQLVQLDRRLRRVIPPGPRRYAPALWIKVALPMVLVWGLYTLLTSMDVLVLKYFRSAEEVAHYFAAAKVLALVAMVHFAASASTAHRFSAYHMAGDRDGLAAFAATTVRWVFWISLVVSLALLSIGRPVLRLFGPEFESGYPVMAILALGMLARASVGPIERLLGMIGHQRVCAVAYVGALAVNFSACLLLAPPYGAMGAAVATTAGFVVESILLFVIAKRYAGLHMFIWSPARQP
ncbi:MAG: polysaccharide biosynthesis C-terminal domain-containing protein [Gammaproteobacteria bacterium]|nr:polysaccharide biosynthesis C-terminal domain-containing protein [Gammaproteobacteria bacterium]